MAKVERADRWPSRSLAAGCDEVLGTDGALLRLWPGVDEQRLASDRRYRRDRRPVNSRADHDRR